MLQLDQCTNVNDPNICTSPKIQFCEKISFQVLFVRETFLGTTFLFFYIFKTLVGIPCKMEGSEIKYARACAYYLRPDLRQTAHKENYQEMVPNSFLSYSFVSINKTRLCLLSPHHPYKPHFH